MARPYEKRIDWQRIYHKYRRSNGKKRTLLLDELCDYIIQDLMVKSVVTKYRLERWQLPDGSYITATLSKELQGHHFGPTLRAYILHQVIFKL